MTEYSHFDEHDFFGEFFPDKDNFSHRFPAKVIYSPSEAGIQIISATLMDEWREVANC
ncbi:hypothetical protein [Aeromonas rivipollensis]|uniref:hypothetical protein n=1 Tax=Aeromonas rivipollensis TaxID=948519 RepID=UPI0038D14E29